MLESVIVMAASVMLVRSGVGAVVGLTSPTAAAIAVGILALGFTMVLGALLVRRSDAPCGCSADDGPAHRAAFLRPAVLIAGAVLLALDRIPSQPGDEVVLAALAGVAAAVLVDLVVATASVPRLAGGR